MSFTHRHEHDEPNYAYDITGVAVSNTTILLISTLGFGALGFVLYFLILRRLSDQDAANEQQENERGRDMYGEMLDQTDAATLNRAQRRARAKFRMKKSRRAAVPGQQQAEGEVDGADAGAAAQRIVEGEGNNDNDMAADANLTRKERQMAAKAKERKERRAYAEEAKSWRNKKRQSSSIDQQNETDVNEKIISESSKSDQRELSLEEIFPRNSNENDALSEWLFWESIAENIKDKSATSDEMISIVEQMPKMTIREFIQRLKQQGSVSIASLANELRISVSQCLDELERINKQHGIVGLADGKGNFVHVSMEMINEAVRIGNDAGIIVHPDSRKAVEGSHQETPGESTFKYEY